MADNQLNIAITATDSASDRIKQIQIEIRTLERNLAAATQQAANWGGAAAAAAEKAAAAAKAEIAALREQASALKGTSEAQTRSAAASREYAESLAVVNANLSGAAARLAEQRMGLNETTLAYIRLKDAAASTAATQIASLQAVTGAQLFGAYGRRAGMGQERLSAEESAGAFTRGGLTTAESAAGMSEASVAVAAAAEKMNFSPAAASAKAAAQAIREGKSATEALAKATEAATAAQAQLASAAREVAVALEAARAAGASESEIITIGADTAAASLKKASSAMHEADGASTLLGRSMRHIVGLFDALARGQIGQAVSSIASGMKDAGVGAVALGAGVGGLVAVMGTRAVIRHAEEYGKLTTEMRANAQAAGMSFENYQILQHALEQVGERGSEADTSLRHLSVSLSTAMQDSASRQAEAFHNLRIKQEELVATGGDVAQVMALLARANSDAADGAAKNSNMEEILGHGYEHLLTVLQGGADGYSNLMAQAKAFGVINEEEAQQLMKTAEEARKLSIELSVDMMKAFADLGPTVRWIIGEIKDFSQSIRDSVSDVERWYNAVADILHLQHIGGGAVPPGGQGKSGPQYLAESAAQFSPDPLSGPGETSRAIRLMNQQAEAAGATAASGQYANRRAQQQAVLQAEIDSIKKSEEAFAEGSDERKRAEEEVNAKMIQLYGSRQSAADTAARQGAAAAKRAAKQSYEDFKAGEEEKIAAANGSASKIAAIYDEWIAAANGKYKQHVAVVEELEKKKVEAVNKGRLEAMQREEHAEDLVERAQMSMAQAGRVQQGPKQQIQSYEAEAAALDQSAQKRIQEAEIIMDTSQKDSDNYQKAAEQILDIVTKTKQKEVELYQKAEAEYDKALAPMTNMFDSIGSQMQSGMEGIFKAIVDPTVTLYKVGLTTIRETNRGQEIARAFGQMLMNMGNDIFKQAMNSVSQLAASAVAPALGIGTDIAQKGLGAVLSAKMGGMLGIAQPQQAQFMGATQGLGEFQAALAKASEAVLQHSGALTGNSAATTQNSAATSVNSAGTQTNSAAHTVNASTVHTGTMAHGVNASTVGTNTVTTGGNSIATATNTVATQTNSAAQSASGGGGLLGGVLGFFGKIFALAGGGIIPSAAGGMVVGGLGGGGQLAVLHPEEMVLPMQLSRGIQDMVSRGGGGNVSSSVANLHYSPTINTASRSRGGTGMSRNEFSQMMSSHGGSMFGEARNLMRSGWRPAMG